MGFILCTVHSHSQKIKEFPPLSLQFFLLVFLLNHLYISIKSLKLYVCFFRLWFFCKKLILTIDWLTSSILLNDEQALNFDSCLSTCWCLCNKIYHSTIQLTRAMEFSRPMNSNWIHVSANEHCTSRKFHPKIRYVFDLD